MIRYGGGGGDGEAFGFDHFAIGGAVYVAGEEGVDEIETVGRYFFEEAEVEDAVAYGGGGRYAGVVAIL